MTTKKQEHRKFWIVPENDTMWIQDDVKYNPEHFADNDSFKRENPIHVVEIEALKESQKQCELLAQYLKHLNKSWLELGVPKDLGCMQDIENLISAYEKWKSE